MKVDNLDKRILACLEQDARQPLSSIAKKLRISKQRLKFRIDNLVKNDIIPYFLMVIDSSKIGVSYELVFIKLQKISPEKEKEVLQYLKEQPKICWIVTSSGNWQIIFSVGTHYTRELYEVLMDFVNKFNEYIQDYETISNVATLPFSSNVAYDDVVKVDRKILRINEGKQLYTLTSNERKVIDCLNKDCRKSYMDIANSIRINRATVKKIMQSLVKRGIIAAFTARINLPKMDFLYYYLLIKMRNINKEQEKELFRHLIKERSIVHTNSNSGRWNLDIELCVKSPEELRNFIIRLQTKFGDIMTILDTILIFEEHKCVYII